MKNILASFFSLSLLAASCASPTPTAMPQPEAPEIPWDDRSIFQAGLVASAQPALDELDGASVYRIDFNIADDLYHVTGTEEARYTNTDSATLTEVLIRLFPNILGGEMTISNLLADGQPVTPNYGLENSLMIVPLPFNLEPNDSVVLKMDFAVVVPQTIDLNYGILAYYDDVLALAHAYPMIAVYDDEGWNAEIPSQDGDVTYADASFFIVHITAPKGLTLVTSGRRVSRDEAGQVQVVTVASGPARDFYLAASPLYEETSQTFGEVTIRSYAPRNMGDGSQKTIDIAGNAIGIFSSRYAEYPYTELDIVSTPTYALGIEYPGMIALTSWLFDVNNNSDNAYLEATVAHEVGHQWFYNLVGDDQLDDPWLDEALAQFATLQYFTDEYGESGTDGFRASLEGRWAGAGNANIPIGLPVAEYGGGLYGAIVYGRGPLFFVALKEEMGAAAFDAFLREYTQTLSWNIATPEALQSLAEKNCGCDLDSIFNEWVYRQAGS